MSKPLQRARDLLATFEDRLRAELPPGVDVFDAHTHLGNDIDGSVGRFEELLAIMDSYGISRCFTFCLDEPDRHPAFRAANDRTLEFAARSDGRMIPYVRLDLSEEPVAEAERCLDLGAKGIKLHPRSQSFVIGDKRLAPIFALAAERRVPILIHGGRGLPPIADDLRRLVDTYSETTLIIAHAGIADLARLADNFAGTAGVFFDTAVWSVIDLLDFFRLVPSEQIVYASDYPYGAQPNSLLIVLRAARAAGLTELQIVDLLAGNANRIANGEPPREPSQPSGSGTFTQSLTHARIHQYLSMTLPMIFSGQQDAFGALGLALNACEERNGHVEELIDIAELLVAARELWRTAPEAENDADARAITRTASRLIHLADILAVTPS